MTTTTATTGKNADKEAHIVDRPPPIVAPLFWPLSNFVALTRFYASPSDPQPAPPRASAVLDFGGHMTTMAGALRAACCAHVAIYGCYKEENGYPAFGTGKELDWSWMWPIVLRNIVVTWVICGFWDWILYFSPWKQKFHKFKFNPKYPSWAQFKHDAFYTTISSLSAAGIEICLCHLWARGILNVGRPLRDAPITNLVWALTITHWRIPHFHFMHRMMHPWKTSARFFPDVGAYLYKHVHSLHHKSYNPTAFGGTNMHPVEGTLYYTSCLIAVAFGRHPVIVLGCIADCAIGAWLGHDGFQWPAGNGDYFHYLHHAHFDCNYGANLVPLDKWFGTFAQGPSDLKQVWGDKSSSTGAKANVTAVHPESKASDKVA